MLFKTHIKRKMLKDNNVSEYVSDILYKEYTINFNREHAVVYLKIIRKYGWVKTVKHYENLMLPITADRSLLIRIILCSSVKQR